MTPRIRPSINWRDSSTATIIVTNLASLLFALYFHWNVFDVMFLYWTETAIIGFFSMLKVAHTSGRFAIFLVPFFCLHFGLFMFGHLTFLSSLFSHQDDIGLLRIIAQHIPLVLTPVLGLFLSHLYSFIHNYLGRREYDKRLFLLFFFYPYPRIIVMHLTIIVSGFLTVFLDITVSLVVLTAAKIYTDLRLHWLMHNKTMLTGILTNPILQEFSQKMDTKG